jgi:hypothetical protein
VFSFGTNFPLFGIYFTDPLTGYAVGGNPVSGSNDGFIVKTVDGGISWSVIKNGIKYALRSIYFIDFYTGFAVGDAGTFFNTTDAGVTWNQHECLTSNRFNSVCFTNSTTGFVAGGNGTILKTTNGGGVFIAEKPQSLPTFSEMWLYPNPATDYLTFHFTQIYPLDLNITLYNSFGNVILENLLKAGLTELTIDTHAFKPGLYIYKIAQGNWRKTGKVVLE